MERGSLADLVGVANQSALVWYSTITQKPVASGAPDSMMRSVLGTDLSGGPTVIGQTAAPLASVVLLAIVVAGIVLVVRR